MNKSVYQKPSIKVRAIDGQSSILAASDTTISLNPNETLDNDQALSKDNIFGSWSDEKPQANSIDWDD